MYAVTVSDHFMIAHSFRGALFGPAQALHGATYEVEAEFRRPDIDRAMTVLREIAAAFDYRNLDDMPELKGINTTTEFLAAEIHRRLAARTRAGDLGPDTAGRIASIKVTLRESPRATASFEGPVADGP